MLFFCWWYCFSVNNVFLLIIFFLSIMWLLAPVSSLSIVFWDVLLGSKWLHQRNRQWSLVLFLHFLSYKDFLDPLLVVMSSFFYDFFILIPIYLNSMITSLSWTGCERRSNPVISTRKISDEQGISLANLRKSTWSYWIVLPVTKTRQSF